MVAGWATLMGIAVPSIAGYTDPIDRPIRLELASADVPLNELVSDLGSGADHLPAVAIHLPSTRPTWREIRDAVRARGFPANIVYCSQGSPLYLKVRLPVTEGR